MVKILDLTRFDENEFIDKERTVIYNNFPHVHVHCYTSDLELKFEDRGETEICCHGCGDSIFIYFNYATMENNPEGSVLSQEYGKAFLYEHAKCSTPYTYVKGEKATPEAFYYVCPLTRRDVKVVDMEE